jgi:6-phosphogluconolactonase
MRLIKIDKLENFIIKIAELIEEKSIEAIKKNGLFHIVLSGGTTPIPVYEKLCQIKTNWSNWHFWICDERMPPTEVEHNCDLIMKSWLNKIHVKSSNIHFISLNNGLINAANNYKEDLKNIDYFDLTLLGIGEDGHSASLFPGNDFGQYEDSDDVLIVINSPKAPKDRITLSANRLSRSKNIIFLAQGEGKKSIIDLIMRGEQFPCNIIKGQLESTLYYLS